MYPDNVDAWNAGEDPQFPGGGENTADVMERINSFCLELNNNADRTIGVITHNVVLRCLIGQSYSIPRILWHRLVIPHAEPMEFKIRDKKIYGNLPRAQLGQIFKELNEYD